MVILLLVADTCDVVVDVNKHGDEKKDYFDIVSDEVIKTKQQ
jgi:hypothetical protein